MHADRSAVLRIARASYVMCIVTLAWAAPCVVHADDGVDHAFDVRRPPGQWNMSDALLAPALHGFDPGDPRVGVVLLVAYLPTPLLIFESVARQLESRAFDIVELLVAFAGSFAAAWGFADSFGNPIDAGLSIETLVTAHALSWNLQLVAHALSRLVFGDIAEHIVELEPELLPFGVDAGAGVLARWEN